MAYLPSLILLIEMPGGGEIIIILLVILLLFGGKKIPELMRGLGRGVREFNDAKTTVTKELEEGMKETPPAATKANTPVDTTPNITNHSNTVTTHD